MVAKTPMARNVHRSLALYFVTGLAVPVLAATVTVESIVQNGGAVPGRSETDPQIVFWGESTMRPPAINDAGDMVFRAKSAKSYDVNTQTAVGLYVKRTGEPLDVLVDTTGSAAFVVVGHPGVTFSLLKAPLVNNNGDVVFWARFKKPPDTLNKFGLFATTTAAGDIVRLVDSDDPVPGGGGALFSDFSSSLTGLTDLTLAGLTDDGKVVFWGMYNANANYGLYGTTVAGGAPVLLANNTGSVIPVGDAAGLLDVGPDPAVNSSGMVVFRGGLGPGPTLRRGIFAIPVTGGAAPTIVALRGQPVPERTATFSDTFFDGQDINDTGTVIFRNGPASEFGLYAAVPDGAGGYDHYRIMDTFGGIPVPGDAAGDFDTAVPATINESGRVGFYSPIRNSSYTTNQGIYAASVADGVTGLVADLNTVPPPLVAPAHFTNLRQESAAVNDQGHMAFWANALDDLGGGMRGVYFYDACEAAVAKIADSTASDPTAGATTFGLYQGHAGRSGHYRSINSDNDVAFLAQFSTTAFGMYVAHVTASGGTPTITCPPDVTLECPADTDPSGTGQATGEGCGTITITYSDASVPGCGGAQTITRTWTASTGSGDPVSCDQIITVADTTAPSLSGVPGGASAECDAVPLPASPTAADACDAAPTMTLAEVETPGACVGDYWLTRTWTATDACGNASSDSQILSVVDTTAPIVTCPGDATGLECPADTSVAARGSATATDNCSDVTLVSADAGVAGCGGTETITRTWTGSDDCGNADSCDQTIGTVDTTPPSLTVDTTPITVTDVDCGGDEAVTLPAPTAEDDCEGSVAVTDDAPATFPAGETTTVTYSASDGCGNASAEILDVTTKYGATIRVLAHTMRFDWGQRPVVVIEPLVGITVHAYARPGHEFCSHHQPSWHGWHWWRHVVHDCDESPPVNSAVTDENGVALIDVPPGDYIVITFFDFDGDGTDDHYLGHYAPNVDCGETLTRYLRLLITPRGKQIAAKIRREIGSELIISEPDMMVWDGEVQEYPFGFEAVGDWGATATVEPPDGFVADTDTLSTEVVNETEAVQFTITEVGSDLVPTRTTLRLRHNGELRTIHSNVGILLTPDYARARGFDVAKLRDQGLIVDGKDRARQPVRSDRR